MRIIKETFLVKAAGDYPPATLYLNSWIKVVKNAAWLNIENVRKTYPSADAVRLASGRTVFVFNVCGNKFRLIVAIHFNRQIVYTLMFLTHAEYDKEKWKGQL